MVVRYWDCGGGWWWWFGGGVCKGGGGGEREDQSRLRLAILPRVRVLRPPPFDSNIVIFF